MLTSNNNHGTSYGSMTSGDQVASMMAGSLDFDGSDDYVQAPDYDILNAIIISAWVNWYVLGASEGIVSKRVDNEVLGHWALRGHNTDIGRLQWMVWSGLDNSQSLASTSYLIADTWTHVVVTFDDSTNTAKIYINGALDNTGTISNNLANRRTKSR